MDILTVAFFTDKNVQVEYLNMALNMHNIEYFVKDYWYYCCKAEQKRKNVNDQHSFLERSCLPPPIAACEAFQSTYNVKVSFIAI